MERENRCEREASIGCFLCVPGPGISTQTGDQTHNLGMCSDGEWNLQCLGYRTTLQPTGPHQPGQLHHYFEILSLK